MTKVRISDIAREAGVSPATVSRYLNDKPGAMTPETRARIAEVIERTGYRPNSAARSLRTDRTHQIGVVLADISNPFSSSILGHLSKQAAADGYTLMCAISGSDPEEEAHDISLLAEAGVDGLVINTCGGCDETIIETNEHLPVVLLDRDVEGTELDLVTSDNATLVTGLVDELTKGGCTTCWLVTEESDTSSIRRERARLFEEELTARGLDGGIFALNEETTSATEQLREIVCAKMDDAQADEAPLGFVAVNGLVFLRLVEALSSTDFVVPDRVRVATFDEYPWNRLLFGGVTTAAQDTEAMAKAVLERLYTRIEQNSDHEADAEPLEPLRLELPGTIIARASTSQ